MVIAGHDDMVSTSMTGTAKDTITALANAIVSQRTFGKVMLEAMAQITSYTLMGEGMEKQD